ncbi:hypothetical protein F5Y03DRAFT_394308 [Xylaria venustula]|nr:hypothetical protein F5Y03DRAFT_394308 [Xylaria venustula]
MSRHDPPLNLHEPQGEEKEEYGDDDGDGDDDHNASGTTTTTTTNGDKERNDDNGNEAQSWTSSSSDDGDGDGNEDGNEDDNDDAVDDTEDLPDDYVMAKKSMSWERRRRQSVCSAQDLLPFSYSPLIRPLTISDLESCIALENAAFANPAYHCTPEKFVYRLTACPELCMGVFCTVVPTNTQGWEIDTLHTARPVETGRSDGAVSVLLAHIVATRSHDYVVTDDAMDYPQGDNTARAGRNDANGSGIVGHHEFGRTVCIHSLAVHPKLQGVGLGKLIVKAYLQQIKSSALADRVALICREHLINYYKRFGFSHNGPSEASLAGGGWNDMVFDLRGSIAQQIP